ncbi:MAG: aminopeptidase [Gammaproteobacteria bacterium]
MAAKRLPVTMFGMRRRIYQLALTVSGCWALSGCGLGYYWQAARGHLELMDQREPVAQVVADPATPASTRDQLEYAQAALAFAHGELALPDNGSYQQYAAIDRDAVVWNVVAAPVFSLEPRVWCFPVAGCVGYRGYFKQAAAEDFARKLREQGDDIYVGGVTAYSTLGRFADPLTSPMLALKNYRLAGLLFHELAHQQVYLPGDTVFNESFASAVEQAGMRLWLSARKEGAARCDYERWLSRRAQVRQILTRSRAKLSALYLENAEPDATLQAKAVLLQSLRDDYQVLRDQWPGPPYFDGWFGPGLNNASLAALAAYDQFVPSFAVLLNRHDDELPAFYAAAQRLADTDAQARAAELAALALDQVSQPPLPENCATFRALSQEQPPD